MNLLLTEDSVESTQRKHAFASASGSKCWMKCTAQPGFVDRKRADGSIPPASRDSEYSKEGTKAHDLAAQCLLLGYDESLFDDEDMAKYVKGYVEVIEGWKAIPGSEFFIEQDVPLFYHEQECGFLDAGVIDYVGRRIFIGDLKYGQWISVQAKENTQIAIYAMSLIKQLMMLHEFDDKWLVVLMIYQPRVADEMPIRTWSVSLGHLKTFCAKIEETARGIYANPDGGKFSPDNDTCFFCDAAPVCGERAAQLFGDVPPRVQQQVTQVDVAVNKIEWPNPESLTVEQLSKIVAVAPDFKAWLGKCEANAHHRLASGLEFPGYKLVEGRSIRKWRNEGEAFEILQAHTELPMDELYSKPKLISPAQAEEKLSRQDWDKVRHLVVKPAGAPTLVPESHQKPSIVVIPDGFFPNLE